MEKEELTLPSRLESVEEAAEAAESTLSAAAAAAASDTAEATVMNPNYACPQTIYKSITKSAKRFPSVIRLSQGIASGNHFPFVRESRQEIMPQSSGKCDIYIYNIAKNTTSPQS